MPHIADIKDRSAGGRLVRKGVARKARRYDVERVSCIAVMGCRVGQQGNELREANNGIRETVREDNRKRRGPAAPFMNTMNADSAFEPDAELRKAIEGGFLRAPVEVGAPIRGKL